MQIQRAVKIGTGVNFLLGLFIFMGIQARQARGKESLKGSKRKRVFAYSISCSRSTNHKLTNVSSEIPRARA